MPPFLPRKRLSSTPPASSPSVPTKRARLADLLDAESRNIPGLDKKKTFSLGSDDSDSSLSEMDDDEFEDVPTANTQLNSSFHNQEDNDDEDDGDDIEWEDAGATPVSEHPVHTPLANGPIELVFRKDDDVIDYGTSAAANKGKKGPTKREKEARVRAHKMHVQFLLWHNSIRNNWISDTTVQQILVQQLPPQIKKEVDRWKRASGLVEPATETKSKENKSKRRGKQKDMDPRKERDWGRPSQRVERGKADMSHGDPLIPFMNVLSAYWKKRFAITAPGLRKRGYGTKQALKQIIYSFRNDEHDPEEHGERIRDLKEFREVARRCEGSRDVGAQLFTALLRGLGIQSRMVASLQPCGFGWTKAEQYVMRKPAKAVELDTSSEESDLDDSKSISEIALSRNTKQQLQRKAKQPVKRLKNDGSSEGPINLDTEADDDDDNDEDVDVKDDDSLMDITPSMPKKRPQKYDRDNPFPIYWTEAVSPITNKVLPVSPLVLASPVASTSEILNTFEPRGAKAERTKTVLAYVVAYSSDGTAKEVTVRYLKKRIWPGKTKGVRFPVEKIPVYNKHGKVRRYEDYDWFKRVMSSYVRPDLKRTAADDVEDSSDLVPQLPEKKDVKPDVDTLQSLKASADFVLERFLRREEALRPGAKPDRVFVSGKGENLKEEPVYRRSDVERCLTAESWHKEGRRPKAGETPLKLVPVRAVTLTRKREAEDYERQTGEKQMQGLYSWEQTEYIIPPPIENGVIPKNAYGNIDCFVPSMIPNGAVHIPLRGTVRICKKLEIDYAEAVTGFEFGNKRAVPICTGVVVAKENEKSVIKAWTKFNEEQKRKEESKMEKLILDLWRKFVMGLRIRERVQDTYGEFVTDHADLNRGMSKDQPINVDDDDNDMPGGALPHDIDDDDDTFGGGGFIVDDEPAVPDDLEMVHQEEPPESKKLKGKDRAAGEYPTPTSTSPFKAPVRRQRRSLPQAAQESQSSELSSLSGDDDDHAEQSEVMNNASDDDEKGSSNPTPEKMVEVSLPGPRLGRPRKAQLKAASSPHRDSVDMSDDAGRALSSGLDDDDSEDYEFKPANPSARRSNAQTTNTSTSTSERRTRGSARSQPSTTAATEARDDRLEGISEDDKIVLPRAKRTSRRLRRDSTIVTSPYFEG